jgi:molecular chaperone GrpE (heat shock protein)
VSLTPSSFQLYRDRLREQMTAVGISSLRALADQSSVSRHQIERLRRGEAQLLNLRDALQLAQSLQLTLPMLLKQFSEARLETEAFGAASSDLRAEYQRLSEKLAQVKSQLQQEFQADVLNILEPLLLQWPTAAHAAQQNPAAPAVRLLPLLLPIEKLLEGWQIERIGTVGETVSFQPQLHQWNAQTPPPESAEPVRVSHVGYRQGDRLLYRAKVKPTNGLPGQGQSG